MILSEMRPDAIFEISSDLGSHDIDKNYDWVSNLRLYYPDLDLAVIPNFIQQARKSTNFDVNFPDHVIDPQSLNENQMMVFKRVESHYTTLLNNPEYIDPLKLIVLETAGTEKSYLIKMIQDRLYEIACDHNINISPVMLLAPISVAVFNIHGSTIYSSFSIPVSAKTFDLTGENLKRLQSKLDIMYYFVIDEKSMVGRHMLALIDLRLRQAFPEYRNHAFGRCSIILVRNFGQLSSVLDELMYSQVI